MHELKTWPSPFDAVVNGVKRFEYRKNDRNFQVGDRLVLIRYDPDMADHEQPKRTLQFDVTYIAHGPAFGIPGGYCVMSIEAPS